MTPEWSDPPGASGRAWFEQKIKGHTRVRGLQAINELVYVVERVNMPDVRVWLCEAYTFGVADYYAVRQADPEVNAVVVLSVWNHYTPEAVAEAKGDGVLIGTTGELMSALHREGG